VSRPVVSRPARAIVGDALEPFNPTLAVVMRHALFRTGVDTTSSTTHRRCLVIAPHPDDETLGAGVTIMRKVDAGTAVHLLVATDGSKSPPGDPAEVSALRAAELEAACTVLGLSGGDVTQLDFVDAELEGQEEALASAIADVVARVEPADVLVTADTDPHGDHAVLGAATRRALVGTGARLLFYPVWHYDRPGRLVRLVRHSGRPELVSTRGYLDRKRAAIAAYPSQMAAHNDDPEGLTPRFLTHFVGKYEMFFPVPVAPGPKGA